MQWIYKDKHMTLSIEILFFAVLWEASYTQIFITYIVFVWRSDDIADLHICSSSF